MCGTPRCSRRCFRTRGGATSSSSRSSRPPSTASTSSCPTSMSRRVSRRGELAARRRVAGRRGRRVPGADHVPAGRHAVRDHNHRQRLPCPSGGLRLAELVLGRRPRRARHLEAPRGYVRRRHHDLALARARESAARPRAPRQLPLANRRHHEGATGARGGRSERAGWSSSFLRTAPSAPAPYPSFAAARPRVTFRIRRACPGYA